MDSYAYIDYDNDIPRIFNDDSRLKKTVAKGSRNKNPKKRNMALMTPSSYLKGKERREYMKASEVKIMHVFDDINNVPKLEDLIKECESREEVKEKLELLRNKHSKTILTKHFGISNYRYYGLLKEYGIELNKTNAKKKNSKKSSKESIPSLGVIAGSPPSIVEKETNFSIKYNKQDASCEEATSKLHAICGILDSDKKYSVNVLISEL